ncbi:MAG TPA: tetratricopeptide repeat protein [Steroidobacteraceae bacterium]
MRKYLVVWLLAIQSCAIGVGSLVIPAAAQAETVSKEVGTFLKAAQEAIAKKRWDEAIGKLKQADAQPKKSAYEQYAINDLMAYALFNTRDKAGAAKYYEANLNSSQVPPAQVPARVKQLATLYFDLKNYPKAIEYGSRWAKNSPDESDAYLLVAQSYYQQKDCKNASRYMQQGMDAARKANQPIKQNWLDLKLFCMDQMGDTKGVADMRMQLVRQYPTREHWDALLTTLRQQQENDDTTTLNYFRLMLDLDVLKKPNDYKEMAEMDITAGVPGEALVVMNKGFASKILETQDKERYTRLLNNARTQAQEVQKKLPQLEQDAKASKTADLDINLGMTYTGFAQYDKAVEALQRALTKNPGKRTDEAQIALGRAYLKLNQKDAARKAFKAVPNDSKLAQVAELYGIYASQS